MSSFNACYLLTTLDPAHVGGTYIGFTVKPSRRIRQHNGEIKAGAWRTKKWRPWEMVMFIHGFPSKVCVQTYFSETLFSCKLLAVHDCAFYEAHGRETRMNCVGAGGSATVRVGLAKSEKISLGQGYCEQAYEDWQAV